MATKMIAPVDNINVEPYAKPFAIHISIYVCHYGSRSIIVFTQDSAHPIKFQSAAELLTKLAKNGRVALLLGCPVVPLLVKAAMSTTDSNKQNVAVSALRAMALSPQGRSESRISGGLALVAKLLRQNLDDPMLENVVGLLENLAVDKVQALR